MNSDTGEFSFHLDLHESARSRVPAPQQPPTTPAKIKKVPLRAAEYGGFDPYNSTGSFDRNNAWLRVRKR